jgi:hypothetical protein
MPYKRVDPVPEREMDKSRYEGHFSVCQKLRDIYHMTEDPEIKMTCRVAMAMTKKMHDKLKYYRDKYQEDYRDIE